MVMSATNLKTWRKQITVTSCSEKHNRGYFLKNIEILSASAIQNAIGLNFKSKIGTNFSKSN